MESIIVAIITGGLALVGVIFTNYQSNKKIEAQLVTAQAVTDTKIDNLTLEVRKHNDFVTRVPVLESRVDSLERRMERIDG